jgi:hypothetical protein
VGVVAAAAAAPSAVARAEDWSDRFNVSLGVSGSNDWTVTINLGSGQTLQNSWNASVSGTSGTLTARPNGPATISGITLYKNGNSNLPTASCSAAGGGGSTTTSSPPSGGGSSTSTTWPPTGGGAGTCAATYQKTNEWPGFGANVTVTAGASAINGWTVRWTWPNGQTITSSWSTTLSTSGSQVTAANVGYNGSLNAGQSTNFGLNGTWNGTNNAPTLSCTARGSNQPPVGSGPFAQAPRLWSGRGPAAHPSKVG